MIDLELVIGINMQVAKQNNNVCKIINKDNLLSALSVQQWYEDKHLRAAALIRSIVVSHGFQDGNKRTAAIVGEFIASFECSENEATQCILAIARGELKDVDAIANILYPISM